MSSCPPCALANLLAVGAAILAVVLARTAAWRQERRREAAAGSHAPTAGSRSP